MVQFCPKCGTKAPDDEAIFCNKCGNKLPINDNLCPKCGTKNLDKQSVFCNKCGSQLHASSQVPVQQVYEQPVVSRPVINKIHCPACGAPLKDDNRYYCDSCGAYLRGSQHPEISVENKTSENTQYNQVKRKSGNINQKNRSERSNAYQPNWIIILLFGFGLMSIIYTPLLVIIVIISAIAVYYDATAIGAGRQYQNGLMNHGESTFNTYTWSPLSWGLVVLLLWIIGFPLYLIKRRELFTLNKNRSFQDGDTRTGYSDRNYAGDREISYDRGQSFTIEFILGLLGGIIGFFAGIAALGLGGLGSALGISNANTVILGGFGAIIFSILGIIGAAIVKRNTKNSGYLMIISAIGGLICISWFYVLSFILLIMAGILAVKNAPPSVMGPAYGNKSKPILGQILIAIGLIIAVLFIMAIIAAFVFGMAGNTTTTKIVSVSAAQVGDKITLTFDGGKDAGKVVKLSYGLNQVNKDWNSPVVGETKVITNSSASKNHVIASASFSDGSTQVVLDTYTTKGTSSSTLTTGGTMSSTLTTDDKITTYSVGDTATIGSEIVTIYSVTYKDKINDKTPESLFEKYPDYKWAVVDVEVQNNDPVKTLPDPYIMLSDYNGYEYGNIYYSGFDKNYDVASLIPGEKSRGFQYYPVPNNVTGLKLKIYNYLLGKDIAIYKGF